MLQFRDVVDIERGQDPAADRSSRHLKLLNWVKIIRSVILTIYEYLPRRVRQPFLRALHSLRDKDPNRVPLETRREIYSINIIKNK